MLKAVIFDLDGTLANTLEDLCDSTNYALEKHGFPKRDLSEFNMFIGDGVPKLIERAIPVAVFTEEAKRICYNEFMAHYRKHFLDKTKLYENIADCVSLLKEKGLKLAVVSNKIDEMTQKIVEDLFCGEFSVVVGKRENCPLKPDPTSTFEVMEKLGVAPSECAFVGDSGMDMKTAKNAGCVAVGVLWGFRGKEELIENGADYLANKPQELAPLILGL